jgi:hypothetical protein
MGSVKLNIAMIATCPFPAAFASSGLIRELSLALHRAGHTIHVVTYHLGLTGFDTKGLHIHRIPNVFSIGNGLRAFRPENPCWMR